MLLSRVLAVFVIAGGLLNVPALAQFLEGDELRVTKVKDNDVLNIRRHPTVYSKIIGFIPPGSDGVIYLGKSQRAWILVQFNGIEGWVNKSFLRSAARKNSGRRDKMLDPRHWEGVWAKNKDQCLCEFYNIDSCPYGGGLPPLNINRKEVLGPELSCEVKKIIKSTSRSFNMRASCASEGSEEKATISGHMKNNILFVYIKGRIEKVWSQGDYNRFPIKCRR